MLQAAGLLTAGAYVQHKASALVGQLPSLRTAEDGSPIFKVSVRLLAASVPGLGEPGTAARQQPFVEAKLTGVEKTSEYAEYFEDSPEGLLSDCPWRFSDTFMFTVKVRDIDVGSGSLKLRMRIRRHAVYGCCNFELEPGEVGIGSADLRHRVLPSCVQENHDWADSEPRWTSPPMLLPLSHVRGGVCGDHIQPGEPAGHLAAVFAVHSPPEVILKALKPSPASQVSSMVSIAMDGAANTLTQMPSIQPTKSEKVDQPGDYTVIARPRVGETEALGSREVLGSLLEVGTRVRVLEVVNLQAQQRLRGRLEHPAGWISLLNTETGHRWAKPVAPPVVDAALAVERVEAMAQSGQYREVGVVPEAPELDTDGWECRRGPHGQTYWHHRAVGPAPWDAPAPKVSKPRAGANLLAAAYNMASK